MTIAEQFGAALRAHRERVGETVQAISDRSRHGRPYLSAVEHGRRNITFDQAQDIAAAYGADITVKATRTRKAKP